MQPHVKHMDVFVRTAVWFVQIANNFGANHEYTDDQKQEYRDPYKLVEHAKSIEDQVNGLWGTFFQGSTMQAEGQKGLKARMAEFIKDERLLKGFTPKFGIGCRRVTPGKFCCFIIALTGQARAAARHGHFLMLVTYDRVRNTLSKAVSV